MPSTDEDDHDGDYGSHVLTNLDSDIFESTASQAPTDKSNKTISFDLRTRNVDTKKMNIVFVSRATEVKKTVMLLRVPTTPIFVFTSSES